jgi:hypothetical protein
VDEIAAGLRHLGGTRIDVVDQVPAWFIAGRRKQPTGRPAGRRTGAKASNKRAPYRTKAAPRPVGPLARIYQHIRCLYHSWSWNEAARRSQSGWLG